MKPFLSNRGSLRKKYRFLPRSAWAELNRLKREGLFSDFPSDPGPGKPALFRFASDSDTGTRFCDVIIVNGDGQVLWLTQTAAALPPLPPLRPLPHVA